jgi:hypothetical protein
VTRAQRGRAPLPEARDRADDEAGPLLAQVGGAEAEALEHARPEALHEHVGGKRELARAGARVLLAQVEPQRAFAAVEPAVEE